jgi:aminoglycoside phosphotransferase (APT) family kinase protein
MRFDRFSGGRSNPTFRIDTPNGAFVLRSKPAGLLQKSAHAIDREFRVMSALNATGFPVPQMLAYCDDESVIGAEFYLMSYIPGRVLWDISMPELSCEERAEAFDSINATIAHLHRLDPVALGLEDFGRGGNYFERQIARWSKQYLSLATEQVVAMDKLIAWLTDADLPAGEETLVHGDFSFHNVLISPDSGAVAAVVDWELSTIGHPLGDVMYHAMEWYRPADCDRRGTLLGRDLAALGIPTLEDYLALYCERAGRPPIENLAFHKAYNLFRMAAIAQGIVGRARQGQLPPETIAIYEPRIRPLAEAAWQHAREAGAV